MLMCLLHPCWTHIPKVLWGAEICDHGACCELSITFSLRWFHSQSSRYSSCLSWQDGHLERSSAAEAPGCAFRLCWSCLHPLSCCCHQILAWAVEPLLQLLLWWLEGKNDSCVRRSWAPCPVPQPSEVEPVAQLKLLWNQTLHGDNKRSKSLTRVPQNYWQYFCPMIAERKIWWRFSSTGLDHTGRPSSLTPSAGKQLVMPTADHHVKKSQRLWLRRPIGALSNWRVGGLMPGFSSLHSIVEEAAVRAQYDMIYLFANRDTNS